MKLFAGRPGECSMIALRPQEMPDRRDWIAETRRHEHKVTLSDYEIISLS